MDKYHFIGMGGIGMSALARILLQRGFYVQGSDAHSSYILEDLQKLGAALNTSDLASCKIIYNSAIGSNHPEYQTALKMELPLLHRSDLLSELMDGYQTLLVTGTHGKTTTASLLAHVLQVADLNPSWAVGGIPKNFSTNGHHGSGSYFVAEADESDGTFLKYPSFGAVITNLEEEHLEHWKTRDALVEGFKNFASNVTDYLWWCADNPALNALSLKGQSYGFSEEADLRITGWKQEGWNLIFDLGEKYPEIELPLIGKHNVSNAAAVFGLALQLKISEKTIREAFKSFQGVKRRMEKKGEKKGVSFYDDYAVHPNEIRATLKGLRKAVGEKRLVVLFQPHRFTRLRDSFFDFMTAFDEADIVCMTDIWTAWEEPLPNITTENFYLALKERVFSPVHYFPRLEFAKEVSLILRPHDVVISLGAGDITAVSEEILKYPIQSFHLVLCCGGKSAEHEISLRSAQVVMENLNPDFYTYEVFTISKEGEWSTKGEKKDFTQVVDRLKRCDLAFPILHGPFGEDGSLQGFFEILNIPYAGADFRCCAVSMDKAWTKHIAEKNGIAVARFTEFSINEWVTDFENVQNKILSNYAFPFYIKPVHLGSTIGVFRIKEEKEIEEALHQIRHLDYKFLVEEEVQGREIEFSFVGNFDPLISQPAEILRPGEIHTYENKYSSSGLAPILNAPMPQDIRVKGIEIAKKLYKAVDCTTFARIDFFLKDDGTWIFNEINPIPGMTSTSGFTLMWKAAEIPLSHILDRIIVAGFHRKRYHDKHLRPPKKPPMEL